jgi:rare lipoprotein A (peptidoglycan hydrolase)
MTNKTLGSVRKDKQYAGRSESASSRNSSPATVPAFSFQEDDMGENYPKIGSRLSEKWDHSFATPDGEDWKLNEMRDGRKRTDTLIYVYLAAALLGAFLVLFAFNATKVHAAEIPTTGKATYYTYDSCIREGNSGICANGEKLNDNAYIAASWFYKFGTQLRVTNTENGKSVIVRVADRGPSKRLVKKGKIIDLSKAAFKSIGSLKLGVINVKVEEVATADDNHTKHIRND